MSRLYLNAVEAIDQMPGRIHVSTYCQDCRHERNVPSGNAPSSTSQCVCLSVPDTGCGIEESIRSRIFDPFFTTKFVGRGLSAGEGVMPRTMA